MALRLAEGIHSQAMIWLRRTGQLLLVFGAALVVPSQAAEVPLEYRIKAAYLFNFTKFVNWPPASFEYPGSPMHLCVFGKDPFGPELEKIVFGKRVNNRVIDIRRIDDPDQMSDCEVLFFGESENARLRSHLDRLGTQAVLTVSDEPQFIQRGGMVRFLIVDGKVRFDINRRAAESAGITISSKLLSVAHTVHQGVEE